MTPGIFASWFHLALGKVHVFVRVQQLDERDSCARIDSYALLWVMQSTKLRTGNNRANQGQTRVEQCMSDLKAYL